MSEFIELNADRWVRRSEIIAFRVLPALGHHGVLKPRVMVALRGESDEWTFEFDNLDEAKAAVRKIRGVLPSEWTEWADSRITCPSTTIHFRTQDSPILWGRWYDGSEDAFRVTRGNDGLPKCVGLLTDNLRFWRLPDFWRHMPVEEKIEILDRIHKAKTEGASGEAHPDALITSAKRALCITRCQKKMLISVEDRPTEFFESPDAKEWNRIVNLALGSEVGTIMIIDDGRDGL